MKYVCELCGSVYDEAVGNIKAGILPGTNFTDLPEDYECPGCGYKKEALNPVVPKATDLSTQNELLTGGIL